MQQQCRMYSLDSVPNIIEFFLLIYITNPFRVFNRAVQLMLSKFQWPLNSRSYSSTNTIKAGINLLVANWPIIILQIVWLKWYVKFSRYWNWIFCTICVLSYGFICSNGMMILNLLLDIMLDRANLRMTSAEIHVSTDSWLRNDKIQIFNSFFLRVVSLLRSKHCHSRVTAKLCSWFARRRTHVWLMVQWILSVRHEHN